MTNSPLERYRARVGARALVFDPAQEKILAELEALYLAVLALGPLPDRRKGLLGGLFQKKTKTLPRGLYLHGDVGRGKSMLMDLFHQSLPDALSHRTHFHILMREAHATLHDWRSRSDEGGERMPADPIPRLAGALTHGKRVLCLDEMDIQDIGDAMIVGRLFEAITALGVVVVTTSNRAPDDLYKNGLQRQKFLPFIDLMKDRLKIVEIVSPVDHRLDNLKGMTVYLTPSGPEADAKLDGFMAALSPGEIPGPSSIVVDGRTVPIPSATSRVARFSFRDLCGAALGSHDYLALAERFDAIMISDIPLLGADSGDEARRFVVLVDAFYENRTALICSAAALPQALYPDGSGAFEFHRTVSRLLEMQTDAYLLEADCKRCTDCNDCPQCPDCQDKTDEPVSPVRVFRKAVVG